MVKEEIYTEKILALKSTIVYIVCQCMSLSYRIIFQLHIIYFQDMSGGYMFGGGVIS